MTQRLYYEDSHLAEFEAEVQSCEPDKNGWAVILNRTAFFPEGGGQPGDTGYLNSLQVKDTRERNGEVVHFTNAPIEPGSAVHGCLNWDVRFRRMQNHSGEHIVSGITHRRFGYSNVGFHMADGIVTIDFDGELTEKDVRSIEEEANRAVFENRRVVTHFPTPEELPGYAYRSKLDITENVRLVEIEGIDLCACCAPHVSQTGEVGLIHIISSMRHRGGMRLTMVCGFNTLDDLLSLDRNAGEISAMLSAPRLELAPAVERLKRELEKKDADCAALRRRLLEHRLEALPETDGVLCLFEQGMDAESIRSLVMAGLKKGADICAAFSGDDTNGYSYVMGSAKLDLRAMSKEINTALSGRGGGKPNMIQGSCAASRTIIEAYINGLSGPEK